MTALIPMRHEHFERFFEDAVASYAEDNVRSLRWFRGTAHERARIEFDRLLPQGRATPDHHLCEVVECDGGQTVGYLWFAIAEAPGARSAFLYNIRILPPFRGRGHAKRAMDLLETRTAELGAASVALHVFAINTTAQALYRSLGYGITGFNMIKLLPGAAQGSG